MKFTIETLEHVHVDDATALDWVILGCLCLFTGYVLMVSLVIAMNCRGYAPLRAKGVRNFMVINLASLVHVWAVFIANDHIGATKQLKSLHCALWSYIIQYAIGLNLWFVAIIWRCTTYSMLHKVTERRVAWLFAHRHAFRLGTALLLCLPVVTICVLVIELHGSQFSEETGSCASALLFKLLIAGWLLVALCLLILCSYVVNVSVKARFFNEGPQLKRICIFSVLIFVACSLLTFSGAVNTSLGRCLFLALVIAMHTYAISKLMVYILYKSVTADYQLMNDMNDDLSAAIELDTIDDELVLNDSGLYAEFMVYCRDRARFSDKTRIIRELSADATTDRPNSVTPKRVASMMLEIISYKRIVSGKEQLHDAVELAGHIVKSYMNTMSDPLPPVSICMYVDGEFRSMNEAAPHLTLFEMAESWAIEILSRDFLDEYIAKLKTENQPKDLNKLAVLQAYQQDKLVDRFRVATMISMNSAH